MHEYDPAAKHEVQKAIREFQAGTLLTVSGRKVTSHEQAVAIGLARARAKSTRVTANQ